MMLSKGALTAIMALTSVVLAIGGFLLAIWQIQMLVSTNQLVHLLGVLGAAAMCWVYLRCLITVID